MALFCLGNVAPAHSSHPATASSPANERPGVVQVLVAMPASQPAARERRMTMDFAGRGKGEEGEVLHLTLSARARHRSHAACATWTFRRLDGYHESLNDAIRICYKIGADES